MNLEEKGVNVGKIHTVVLDVKRTTDQVLDKIKNSSQLCQHFHDNTKTEIDSIWENFESFRALEETYEVKVTKLEKELEYQKLMIGELREKISEIGDNCRCHGNVPQTPRTYNCESSSSSDSNDGGDDDDASKESVQNVHTAPLTEKHRAGSKLRNVANSMKGSMEINHEITNTKYTAPCGITEQRNKHDKSQQNSKQERDKRSSGKEQTQRSKTSTTGLIQDDGLEQTTKKYYSNPDVWTVQAKAERMAGSVTIPVTEGVFTVILLDTSASMQEDNAWHEVHTFLSDYISGLEKMAKEHGCDEEYVSLVVFGAETKCQQRFTNDLQLIKDAFDRIQPGGPSPLFGGYKMVQGVVLQTDDTKFYIETNEVYVRSKVIVITDGHPTETLLYQGPDTVDPTTAEETITTIRDDAQTFTKLLGLDFFCVPIGRANNEFLNELCDVCDGKILGFRDGQQLARRLMLTTNILPPMLYRLYGSRRDERIPIDKTFLTRQDISQMREVIETSDIVHISERKKTEVHDEIEDTGLPHVGTRVRRGPDWMSDDQDNNGPGTVIGHFRDYGGNYVWVIWDGSGDVHRHEYGHNDRYSVFMVEEPKVLLPGQPLNVGCIVTTGKDFVGSLGPSGEKGVIVRMVQDKLGSRKAMVRWANGDRAIYSCGFDSKFEIRICSKQETALWRPSRVQTATDGMCRCPQCTRAPVLTWSPAPPLPQIQTSETEEPTFQEFLPLPIPVTKKPKRNKNKNANQ